MPNWCSNYITISGEESNMKPLYDFFREGEEIVETYYKQFREFRENFLMRNSNVLKRVVNIS